MFLGCQSQVSENLMTTSNPDVGHCPKGHTDDVIPIIYGMPTEEMFAKADSGLVYLGGCELGDDNWYCNEHEISF